MPRTDILIFDGLAIQDGVPEDGLQHPERQWSIPSDVPMQQMRHRNKVMGKYDSWSFVVKDHLWSENTSDWLWNEVVAGSSFQKKTVPRWNDQTSKWQTVGGNRPSSHPLTHRCMFSRSIPQKRVLRDLSSMNLRIMSTRSSLPEIPPLFTQKVTALSWIAVLWKAGHHTTINYSNYQH